MFKTKSVHTEIEPHKDGLRILATRGRGRGLPKDRYIVWMANLGPSERLRNEFLTGKTSWAEFGTRYARELREDETVDRRNKKIKNHGQKFTLRLLQHLARSQTVTLLCHCAEDEKHCHRHLLRALLEGNGEVEDPWRIENSGLMPSFRFSMLYPRSCSHPVTSKQHEASITLSPGHLRSGRGVRLVDLARVLQRFLPRLRA